MITHIPQGKFKIQPLKYIADANRKAHIRNHVWAPKSTNLCGMGSWGLDIHHKDNTNSVMSLKI